MSTTDLTTAPGASGRITDGAWQLDPTRSSVGFHVRHFYGLMTVKGEFADYDSRLNLVSTPAVELTLQAASLHTKHAKRDEHVRSKDFFDVERYPTFQVVVDKIGPVTADSNEVQVRATLTVRETVKPLTFIAHADRRADSVTLTATIPYVRADFGMTWNQLGMMAGKGEIGVKLRFTRQG